MEELLKKIKKTIDSSSFPLEMRLANFLEKREWATIIGRQYYDFEYDKLSENDIVARKEINGITLTIFIECKKSSDKQLIMYSPYKNTTFSELMCLNTQYFPKRKIRIDKIESDLEYSNVFLKNLSALFNLNQSNLLGKNIIFTKGDSIIQDNQKFFSSLNGLVKSTIWFFNQMKFTKGRDIYLYLVVYDGIMLGLVPDYSKAESFDLKQIDYAIYNSEFLFNYNNINTLRFPDVKKIMELFGSSFLIQFITPIFFETYVNKIEEGLSNFDKGVIGIWKNEKA